MIPLIHTNVAGLLTCVYRKSLMYQFPTVGSGNGNMTSCEFMVMSISRIVGFEVESFNKVNNALQLHMDSKTLL